MLVIGATVLVAGCQTGNSPQRVIERAAAVAEAHETHAEENLSVQPCPRGFISVKTNMGGRLDAQSRETNGRMTTTSELPSGFDFVCVPTSDAE